MDRSPIQKPLLLLLALATWTPLLAQVSYQPAYHPGAGNPGNLNQEADFSTTGWNLLMDGSLLSNQWSNPGNIPFNFEFFGEQVSFFKASANGLITFDMTTSSPPGNNALLPSSSVPDSTILCFWEQFTTSPPIGSNDRVETKLFGNAPNRQLWIRWHSYEWGPCSFAYLAVVLEESSNKVYVVDLFSSTNANLVSSTVGIQAHPSFAIPAAHNVPLSGAGSNNSDNSYYSFTPFQIEPYDTHGIAIEGPSGDVCGLGNEPVTIRFSNIGLFTATGMTAKLAVDAGSFSAPEAIPGSLAPGDTMTYTLTTKANLSQIGPHELRVVVQVNGDNNHGNDTIRGAVRHLVNVATFPYEENFENGAGGWIVGGSNTSWELGYPNKTTIKGAASGVNAWVTGRTLPHNGNESSWVTSPCFDLSTLTTNPVIAMKVWWESEYSWDGAVLQYSLDDGSSWQRIGNIGQGISGYNDNSINSLPGGQMVGWSGQKIGGTGSSGWVATQFALPAAVVGQPKVLFRIAFASDGSSNLDGFAFDDIVIGNAPVVNLGTNQFFCPGAQLSVGVANNNASILWSTGATSPSITLQNATGAPIIDSVITVKVTNAQGLESRDTIRMSMTVPPSAQVAAVTSVACHGEATGAIDLTMVGGASPFTYAWAHGATTQDLTGLAAGTYQGQVTDINGCKATIAPVTVTQNDPLAATFDPALPACHGDSTGELEVLASGGAGPYQISWAHGATGNLAQALPAGDYSVTITDSEGCSSAFDATLTEPAPLELFSQSFRDASCPIAADGSISLELSGGTAPYSFAWNHGSTAEDPDSLGTGIYTGIATDQNGCELPLPVFTISFADSFPTAAFSYGMAGAQVGFQDSSIGAVNWFWDFGDGNSSTLQHPGHLYEENGVYAVTLIVSNPCGSDTVAGEVNIISASLEAATVATLRVFPNPSEGGLSVELGSSWAGQTHFELSNPAGQVVWSSEQMVQPGQTVSLTMPASLARGMYLLSARQGRQRSMTRVELR